MHFSRMRTTRSLPYRMEGGGSLSRGPVWGVFVEETLPPRKEGQTRVKTLPCSKFRVRTVKMS